MKTAHITNIYIILIKDFFTDLLLHHLPTFFSTVNDAHQKAPIIPLRYDRFNNPCLIPNSSKSSSVQLGF